jgi:rubredoxin
MGFSADLGANPLSEELSMVSSMILCINPEVNQIMSCYQCSICGHVYDPSKGEPSQNIGPGIDFNDLPSDWCCPICLAEKKLFRKV